MQKRKIYVASSWRNEQQQDVVNALRKDGHEVYDFKHHAPDNNGFHWSAVESDYSNWTPTKYARAIIESPIAAKGFAFDRDALYWCDTCVLVLPSGRSAHIEAGYAAGQGKHLFVLLSEQQFQPELMYLLANGMGCSINDMLVHFRYADDRCKLSLGW